MLGAMFGAVVLVFGLAFRSVAVPLRAVLSVSWLLAITFGLIAFATSGDMAPIVASAFS